MKPRFFDYYLLLFLGVIGFTCGYIIGNESKFNPRLILLTQLSCVLLFFLSLLNLIRFRIENHYLKFIFYLYIFWAFYIIIRGLHFDILYLQYLLTNPNYGVFLYFAPLVVLIPWNAVFAKRLFVSCFLAGIAFLVLVVLFRGKSFDRSPEFIDAAEMPVRMLAIPCGFLLLTYKYHKGYKSLFALIVMILALLFAIYKGRRGLSTTVFSVLFVAYLILFVTSNFKGAIIYFTILILVLAVFYASNIYDIGNNKLLNLMANRGTEDTRTGVEVYFYNDMDLKDWLIGRGLDGKYFYPNFDEGSITNYRSVIETGYLQIILKGGLIRLGLLLLMAVPAAFLGIFKSRNILSKASGFWIAVILFALYPDTVESFNLFYLLFWVSIGICYSAKLRNMSDADLIESFDAS